MDPFVSTIVKQGLALGLVAGVLVFGVVFYVKMAALQNASNRQAARTDRGSACRC